MEAKPFASLSSGLLARKGAARPAMRPQGFGQVGGGLEDLGWNDMGFEPPKPAAVGRDGAHDAFGQPVVEHAKVHPTGLTPVHSPVHDQQAELVERLNGIDEPEEDRVEETVELTQPDEDPVEETAAFTQPDEDPVDETAEFTRPDEDPVDETAELYEPAAEKSPTIESIAAPVFVPAPAPRRQPRPRVARGTKPKAAFTLRLDPDRHLKLRLACAVDGRSAQQLVTDALDQLLERMPEVDGLAAKAKRRG